MKTSVGTALFDHGAYIERTIESMLSQRGGSSSNLVVDGARPGELIAARHRAHARAASNALR